MSVRRTGVVFLLAVLAIVGTLLLTGAVPASQAAQTTPPAPTTIVPGRTITVVGRGEVKAKPDTATTTLGVEVTGATVDAAMTEAQARMDAVIAALKKMGIADNDIQTSNFSINFERQQPVPGPQPTTTGKAQEPEQPAGFYRVSNMVQVTIRALDTVGDVIDTSVKAGANNVWGISFGIEDTKALEGQAREKAVADARERAGELASLNNVSVGDVVSVSEVIGTASPMFAAEMSAKGLGGGGTPIEQGEVSLSTQVQVVYAIK